MTEPTPGTLDDEPPEAIEAAVREALEFRSVAGATAVVPVRWHRGDRVIRLPDGPRGIVEGWKRPLVLVLWGVSNNTPAREWVPEEELALDPASGQTGQPA